MSILQQYVVSNYNMKPFFNFETGLKIRNVPTVRKENEHIFF